MNKDDTKSEAATATPLAITVVVDGGPAPPSAALYSILSHALQSSLKATSNVCIAGERVLDDPEDPTGETTAQIGLYAHLHQNGRTSCNRPGPELLLPLPRLSRHRGLWTGPRGR